jgi:hypothetical protein
MFLYEFFNNKLLKSFKAAVFSLQISTIFIDHQNYLLFFLDLYSFGLLYLGAPPKGGRYLTPFTIRSAAAPTGSVQGVPDRSAN